MQQDINKHKVVIIGGNFAGITAAKQLAISGKEDLELYLVDPRDSFTWTPNIHEILSGTKNQENVEISRSQILAGLDLNFVQQQVVALDCAAKSLTLGDGSHLEFDACLVACGYCNKPELTKTTGFHFRNASDVGQIARAIAAASVQKDQVTISIIGGGFTGVEALGELIRRYGDDKKFTFRLIEGSARLVPGLPQEVSDDILQLCSGYQVEFQFGRRITGTTESTLILSDASEQVSDVTIWSTGGVLPSFLQDSGLALPGANGVAVKATLQSQLSQACFVAGDAANIVDNQAKSLAKQSYHAIDSGNLAAKNLLNWLRGNQLEAFTPRPKPVLLAFGNSNTYMVSGNSAIASPTLAAAKEALYQISVYKLLSQLPLLQRKQEVLNRLFSSVQKLLLPELKVDTPIKLLQRSRILKLGSLADLKPLLQGVKTTLFETT